MTGPVSFIQRIFSHNLKNMHILSETASQPIRARYQQAQTLDNLAKAIGAGKKIKLPAYTSFTPLGRLNENAKIILYAFRSLDAAARNNEIVTPAAQWLVDNYYTIDKTVLQIRRDFPKQFLRQLPKSPLADGLPRIFALAWAYIGAHDSVFSRQTLTALVESCQEATPLTIGELWALPSAVRFMLVENARRLALRIAHGRQMRASANKIADSLAIAAEDQNPQTLLVPFAELVPDTVFSSHLLYRLRSATIDSSAALAWLEEQCNKAGQTMDEATDTAHTRQAESGVSMGNIIRALKAIDDVDWTAWFENVSHVDFLLRDNSDFGMLDTHSRNAYRVVVEQIARRSPLSETDVAHKAIDLAKADSEAQSIAFYLVGDSRPALEQACSFSPPWRLRFMRFVRRLKIWSIALPVSLLVLAIAAAIYSLLDKITENTVALLLTMLALFPAMNMAFSLFSTFASWFVAPARLVGYEYKDGIPEEARTLVAVPTMMTSHDFVDEQLRNIEVHYLNNPRGAISFALVTDWADAPWQESKDDLDLFDYAGQGIDALNRHYCGDGQPVFFLLHRRRCFNESEGCWMGWERKRGKLHELNLLLRGDSDTSFFASDPRLPDNIRFVMTLDSDTRLTRNAVTRLAGKLNHPLNRPQFDEKTRCVTRGYGILQPRVTASLTTGDEASFLQRVFSVNRGLDPYVFAVSDTYQDLLGEGTFTGKGLYDIDAFEAALAGRVQENAVLSHDLLEAGYARAALVSDVEVIEDYPTAYHVDAARHHRWTRGDWQLLPYLFGRKQLNATSRWKMRDNLRRSLTPALWILASLTGWCLLPFKAAILWQLFLLAALYIAPLLGILRNGFHINRDYLIRGHIQSIFSSVTTAFTEIVLRVTFMAHTACYMVDAALRALYRMGISRRHLLEWRTAAASSAAPNTVPAYIGTMWTAPIVGAAALGIPAALGTPAVFIALPFALLWFFSPLIAWGVSRSAAAHDALALDARDAAALRHIARRTWHYYQTFVTQEHNHLPPDNFQEDPEPVVAKRTSPTNIGVYLLSTVAARDFGWLGFQEAIDRIEKTLATLGKIEKHQGHLYNWYETDTLRPLQPLYISTVDSGNLAGHLVTLSAALKQWAESPAVHIQGNISGLLDICNILQEDLRAADDSRQNLKPLFTCIFDHITALRKQVMEASQTSQNANHQISRILTRAGDIARFAGKLGQELGTPQSEQIVQWAQQLLNTAETHAHDLNHEHDFNTLREKLDFLAESARGLAFDMKFDFLERKERRLLSIGYRVEAGELDEGCYDLLASEARLSSLFAIAKGDVKVEHWFQLGRPLVPVGWHGALLSWSGSMFEYLMPPLVMRESPGSLLEQTNRLIIRRQIDYAQKRDLPWGISEAAFNARDPWMNYQYSNFGVPSLGLQRGLSRNAVIAPYASLLAAQYMPKEAVKNLRKLAQLGALGRYGYHDSVDFTPSRLPQGARHAVIRNYYAHHHGMSILAVNNVVFEGRMRERFHSDPVIEAVELLLQEKAPQEIPVLHAKAANPMRSDTGGFEAAAVRSIKTPLASPRATLLMAAGAYQMMLTASGSGYSRWNGFDVTRFQPDGAEDQQGTFLFLRDAASGRWWSATGEPTRVMQEEAHTAFTAEKAEFYKVVDGIQSTVECIAASQGEGEGRRIRLVNTTGTDKIIEVTSYGELALARSDDAAAHPVFSQMFVETEIADKGATIFASRRKRAPQDADIHIAHFVTDSSGAICKAEAETGRRQFIGRGRSIRRPAAFDRDAYFEGTQGCVMDPVMAIRCRVRVPAHKQAELVFWTLAADRREKLADQIAWYRQPNTFTREFSAAWTRTQVTRYQLGLRPQEASDCQAYAGYLIYPERPWLAPETIAETLGSQADLWPMAISGDYPLFVLRIDNENHIAILQGLLRAHEYWRRCGLIADIVILNERGFSYAQDTQRAIEWVCEGYCNRSVDGAGKPHIFIIRKDTISQASFNTLLGAARIVLHAGNGTLAEQLQRMETIDTAERENRNSTKGKKTGKASSQTMDTDDNPQATAIGLVGTRHGDGATISGHDLNYWNGYGGFAKDGSYVVRLSGANCTPHPWINVISNHSFGIHVSAEGAAFSWADNSRDYQLTPWSNDPVSNRPGEALYIVDRDSKARFSPVAAVERNMNVLYEAQHGAGFSAFRSTHDTLALELVYTVHPEEPLRLARLRVHNKGKDRRQLRLYNYTEWVLGSNRAKTAPFLVPGFDKKRGALLMRNPYSTSRGEQLSFVSASQLPQSVTSNRAEFIGTTGTTKHPAAIRAAGALSNTVESGHDPCSALAYDMELEAGETKEIVFYLGHAASQKEAAALIKLARTSDFDDILARQRKVWKDFTGRFQIKTPDPAFDLLVNHWLPYQAYACRIMARSAFYQASGAFGFRDQLQDSLSMMLLKPELAHDQIINAAGRQFEHGDVQHWWLPESGAGVRTLISDDVVWLGYGTALYTATTGDYDILDKKIAFLEGDELADGRHEAFFQPEQSGKKATLYEHCALALDLAVKRTGKDGLPLILGGDWNDGMNLVGIKGKGESVWLGWFLSLTLQNFIPIAEERGDEKHVIAWKKHLHDLNQALESHAWDGAWYRRGSYDNGTLLGTSKNDECRIDVIAQAWSVLSGAGAPKRREQAMQSVFKHLVDKKGGLVRLFWPPFDKGRQQPGYIKGYPPGIRENGGQYTHGALWSILAMAKLGENEKAWQLFSMLNPIHHGADPETYRVEPYVIAADVYSVEPHRGQGGWTWYTGAAGWYYRVATEGILGLHHQGDKLFITPVLPKEWNEYSAQWRYQSATYRITVDYSRKAGKKMMVYLDGDKIAKPENGIALASRGKHEIRVILPRHE